MKMLKIGDVDAVEYGATWIKDNGDGEFEFMTVEPVEDSYTDLWYVNQGTIWLNDLNIKDIEDARRCCGSDSDQDAIFDAADMIACWNSHYGECYRENRRAVVESLVECWEIELENESARTT